jgi:predicted DNA-binding transcriptional regulator YafY
MKTEKKQNSQKQLSRKTLPKPALERFSKIDKEIASGKFPNCEELSKVCTPISIATINRDIEFMRDRLNAPIEYDALKRGYYYSEKTYRLPMAYTSEVNLLAFGMAKNILSLYRETPLYEPSVNFVEEILAPLTSEGKNEWLKNRIIVPKIASARVDTNLWEIVVKGLKENRIITFDYIGIGDEGYQSRKVRPYQLLFDSGVWYLFGYSEERRAIRTFSLSRMKNAALTKELFTLPNNFDYNETTGNSYFGVYSGQEKYQFSIECYEDAAIYAAERQWADDQKIIENDDGITIKFSSTQYYTVLQWVLSCGCNAVPQKPRQLVDDWGWHIQEMRKRKPKK